MSTWSTRSAVCFFCAFVILSSINASARATQGSRGLQTDEDLITPTGLGSNCGFPTPKCSAGLSCDFNYRCIKTPKLSGKKGGSCGLPGQAHVCDKGLSCDLTKSPPNISGVCVAAGPPVKKAGFCRGATSAQCAPGLTCDGNAVINYAGVYPGGLCVDGSCSKCPKDNSPRACGTDPATKKRRAYINECYAKCLGATQIEALSKAGPCLFPPQDGV